MVDFNQWRQYRDDYFKVCDLLLDAYLHGFNDGFRPNAEPNSKEVLEELVRGEGLDPKIVLRRLYCPQQIEENGECKCD